MIHYQFKFVHILLLGDLFMEYQIVSIKTSVEKALSALTENDKKNNIEILPPLQAIFFIREQSIALPEDVQEEDLSGDIAFVKIPKEISLDDVDILEFFEPAPITMVESDNKSEDTKEETPVDSIENLFGELEKEIERDTFEEDFLRISDVYTRVHSSPEDAPTIVEIDNGVLGKVIPDGYAQHYLLFNETELVYDDDGIPINLDYSINDAPSYLCAVKRIDLIEGEGDNDPSSVQISADGDFFFVASTTALFGVESFLPGILTVVSANTPTEDEELDIAISSWKVRSNHFEPLPPVQSNEILNLNKEYLVALLQESNNEDEMYSEIIEELTEQIDTFVNYGKFYFRDPIESIDMPLVRSVFGNDTDDIMNEIIQALLNIEDDE